MHEMQEVIANLLDELKKDFKTAVDRIGFDEVIILLEEIKKQDEVLANALAEPVKEYNFNILQMLFEGG